MWTNELLPKIWVFLEQIWMKSVTLKVGGVTWGHFGRFPLFHGASNMCTRFFPNPSGQVVHNLHLVQMRKKPTHIGHHMWKILAPKFEQHMELSPKTSNANPTKIPKCLEYVVLYVILARMEKRGGWPYKAHATELNNEQVAIIVDPCKFSSHAVYRRASNTLQSFKNFYYFLVWPI